MLVKGLGPCCLVDWLYRLTTTRMQYKWAAVFRLSGLLWMCPSNERQRYNVMSSLTGQVHSFTKCSVSLLSNRDLLTIIGTDNGLPNITIIGSDNGLSPGQHQAIIWTGAGILLIGPLGTNFSEILIENHIFSFKIDAFEKVVWEMSSILSRPPCAKLAPIINHIHT